MTKTFSPTMSVIEDAGRVEEAKGIIKKLSGKDGRWDQLNEVEKRFICNLSIANLQGQMKVTPKQLNWLRKIRNRLFPKEGKA